MNKLSVVLTITCSCSNNNKYSIRNDKLLLRSGLTVTAQDLGVAALPRGALGGAELGSLHGALVAEAAVLAAGGGESALLAVEQKAREMAHQPSQWSSVARASSVE